jgi:hypothetical protein
MQVMLSSAELRIQHRGPVCIACSNWQRFWVEGPDGEQLVDVTELPDGEIRIQACGRCRSRNSIVVGHVD